MDREEHLESIPHHVAHLFLLASGGRAVGLTLRVVNQVLTREEAPFPSLPPPSRQQPLKLRVPGTDWDRFPHCVGFSACPSLAVLRVESRRLDYRREEPLRTLDIYLSAWKDLSRDRSWKFLDLTLREVLLLLDHGLHRTHTGSQVGARRGCWKWGKPPTYS